MSPHQVKAWEEQFVNLCKYKEENGDCDVPIGGTCSYKGLGEWVKRQRKVYHRFHSNQDSHDQTTKYLVERFERLTKIGFNFRIGSGNGKKTK